MVRICGNVYESVRKYHLIYPLKIEEVARIGVDLGYRCIDVDYVLWIPSIHLRHPISDPGLEELIMYLVHYGISDKENWKRSARGAYEMSDLGIAIVLLNSLVSICGGAWLLIGSGYYNKSSTSLYVWTKGYYHYIGA